MNFLMSLIMSLSLEAIAAVCLKLWRQQPISYKSYHSIHITVLIYINFFKYMSQIQIRNSFIFPSLFNAPASLLNILYNGLKKTLFKIQYLFYASSSLHQKLHQLHMINFSLLFQQILQPLIHLLINNFKLFNCFRKLSSSSPNCSSRSRPQ